MLKKEMELDHRLFKHLVRFLPIINNPIIIRRCSTHNNVKIELTSGFPFMEVFKCCVSAF